MYGNRLKPALQASGGGVHQVFVYGTLKNGESNHAVMGDKRLLKGHARAHGFVMVDLGNFPGAVKVPNGGWHIYGEVYEVNDETFKRLDALEGYPRFYNREVIDLDYYGKTWIYTLPREGYLQDGCRFIPCGRWNKTAQAYLFYEDKLAAPYKVDRPLIMAPMRTECGIQEPRGEVVPEKKKEKEEVEGPIVGPGWEEA